MTLKEEVRLLERKVKLLKKLAELEEMIGAKPEVIPDLHYPLPGEWKIVPYYPYTPPYGTGDPLPSEPITVCNDFKTISAN